MEQNHTQVCDQCVKKFIVKEARVVKFLLCFKLCIFMFQFGAFRSEKKCIYVCPFVFFSYKSGQSDQKSSTIHTPKRSRHEPDNLNSLIVVINLLNSFRDDEY